MCMYVSVCVCVCVYGYHWPISSEALSLETAKTSSPCLGLFSSEAGGIPEGTFNGSRNCEERQSVRHQHPYLEYVAHGVSGNYHSQLVVRDGLIIPHRYDTMTHGFNKLSICSHIAEPADRWELGPSKAPSPTPTHSRGAQHPLTAS